MNNKKNLLSLFEQMLNADEDERNEEQEQNESTFNEEEAKQNAENWAKTLKDR